MYFGSDICNIIMDTAKYVCNACFSLTIPTFSSISIRASAAIAYEQVNSGQ